MRKPGVTHAVRAFRESGATLTWAHWSIRAERSASTVKPVTACITKITNAMRNTWILRETAPVNAARQPVRHFARHNDESGRAQSGRECKNPCLDRQTGAFLWEKRFDRHKRLCYSIAVWYRTIKQSIHSHPAAIRLQVSGVLTHAAVTTVHVRIFSG